MVVKVYGPARAACPQRVMACLLEKGIEFEIVSVDLDSGEQKKPDFLALQPFGQVPVVEEEEGFRLFESRAIIRYYATKHADQGTELLGSTLKEQALVNQWLEVEAHNYNEPLFAIVLQLLVFPSMGLPTDPAVVKANEARLSQVLDVYDQHLAKNKYLAGQFFSMADLSHLPGTQHLVTTLGMSHLVKERQHVNAWWEDISSRPAWKKVLQLVPKPPE
ncbi:glutathione S-transferase F10-like [Nymphaea colorata]|nr:glutathione S-transferase F10-like [Nymphaea colorata]